MDPPETKGLPERPDAAQRQRIGVDEWVAEAEDRTVGPTGWSAPVRRAANRVPPASALALFALVAATIPALTSSDYVIRVGADTLIYMLLALGLNIVVGYAGLLDLGYIAFFGFGAYLYAILASPHFGYHWQAELAIPVVVVASALLGLLLGLPSRRLVGDYLAIVTLFFGQIFVTVTLNSTRITPPGLGHPLNLTGGPDGLVNIDDLDFFGYRIDSVTQHFYAALVMFLLVFAALHFFNDSRTGRALRALREDPLAAELLTIPVNRLKLMAFAFGAAVAGLTGTVYASLQTGVFPTNFDLPLLITIYAMVILGGTGSIVGAAAGAVTVNVILEVLTTPEHARWVFYGVILVTLLLVLRPLWWVPVVLGGTVVFGLAVHAIVGVLWERGTAGSTEGSDVFTRVVGAWVLLPSDPKQLGNIAFVGLVATVLGLTLVKGVWRKLGLIPVLYLAAFVWENRLVIDPSVTRLVMLGAILVALMNARPQGLFGTPRVEVV